MYCTLKAENKREEKEHKYENKYKHMNNLEIDSLLEIVMEI